MKFHVGLPTDHVSAGTEFVSADGIAAVARAAEAAGFDQRVRHRAPVSRKTRGSPPVGTTRSIRSSRCRSPPARRPASGCSPTSASSRTGTPSSVAKAALTLDVLSGGRLTLGVGAGYLEPEFRALGVDFEERNELLDEGLVAIKRAWTEDGVEMTGRHFEVRGHTMLPRPVQSPHPPIWVGGNSKRAIRRAVDLADGWTPMPNPRALGARRRSAHLETVEELQALIAYADDVPRARPGTTVPFEISVMPMGVPGPGVLGLRARATRRPRRRARSDRHRRPRADAPVSQPRRRSSTRSPSSAPTSSNLRQQTLYRTRS